MKKKANTPTPKRRPSRIMISLPAEERLRLANFSREVGRPISWVVRDAVREYAQRLRPIMEQVRASANWPPNWDNEDPQAADRVPVVKMGRPPKPRRSMSYNKP